MMSTGHDRHFIIKTGHCRRLYSRFTQLGQVPQNTLKIHGCVLWHLPVTTGHFIIKTGHCRRLYSRLIQFGQVLQNTLKIHGRVLWHLPVTTDCFINVPKRIGAPVDRRRFLILRPGRALPTVRIIVPSSPMVSV